MSGWLKYAMVDRAAKIPLALYVHIPWCIRKCPYCDFNSHQMRQSPPPEAVYTEALLVDLDNDLARTSDRPVQSIFIGGGTPSLFSPEAIDRLLRGLRRRLRLGSDVEITLEANPGAGDRDKFREFRDAGINRLSIGIQSFNDTHLERLGRIHGSKDAIRAAENAHAVGFDNFNLDLMFGLPAQTTAQALVDIDHAISLSPTHISHYQLTLEPNTVFQKYPPVLPDDDQLWQMQQRCRERLSRSGYHQYEVSAFACPGKSCRHNLNYWEFGDYLGIGAGAHGKLTDPISGKIFRLWKRKTPRDYSRNVSMAQHIGGFTEVPPRELTLEFMMNALRLRAGFSKSLFSERTGLDFECLRPGLDAATEIGLLSQTTNSIQATDLGWRFLNDLLCLFLPEADAR